METTDESETRPNEADESTEALRVASSVSVPMETEITENKDSEQQNRLRKRAIDELITTEKTYVNGLESLFKVFVNPLKNAADTESDTFVSCEDHCIIFPSDLMTIYALHSELSADLIQCTKQWDPETSKIGHIFIKYGDLFKMYNIYFFKHEKAIQHLVQLKGKNDKFAQWCQEQSSQANGLQLNIESLLILPIQRLPRYGLLLKEIIKRTQQYHVDLYHLQEALEQVCEITELINERMKENDRRMKVAMVEKRFIDLVDSIGFFVKPSRIFIAESSEITRHDQYGNRIPITLFLFNDCLIYGYHEESYTTYSYGYGYGAANLRFGAILVFDSLFMIEEVSTGTGTTDEDEDKDNHRMHAYNNIASLKVRARHHAMWISFDSHNTKAKWFEMITKQNAIQQTLITNKSVTKKENEKEKSELCVPRPVFVPDDYSNCCMDCEAKFSILLRRHHCYLCGKLCCNDCTKNRSIDIWKLHFEDKEEYVRICAECNEDHQNNEVEMMHSDSDSAHDVVNDQKHPATTFDITKNHLMKSTRVSRRREKMKKCQQKACEKTNTYGVYLRVNSVKHSFTSIIMSVAKAIQMLDDLVQLVDTIDDDTKEQPSLDLDAGKYVMGLDSSTQSLTISIYDVSSDANFNCIATVNINFDNELGDKYGVKNGVIKNEETLEVMAPSLMFIEALDIALLRLQKENKIDFSRIVSISGSGQQHGSVYWKTNAIQTLQNLDPNKSLLENLLNSFALHCAPIWMDSSTTKQCRALEFKVGSSLKVAQISGSRAYERFTGNQIAKMCETHHDIYSEQVERISLISSFMCSLFIGDYASIDLSDGSGMNLLDITNKKWSNILLESTAVGLKSKLGELVSPSYQIAGKIDKYFVEKYGFNAECDVVAFSGDNPCSLAGLMCYEEGDICVSLGTSDTLFAVTQTPKPQNEGHVLCSPLHENAYMILLCYKNGSISRENIRNKYVEKDKDDWSQFNSELFNDKENGGAGNNGRLAFYYDHAEILPTVKPGMYRFDANDNAVDEYKDNGNGSKDIRAIIESQFMAMRQHMEQFGVRNSKKVLATGGASANKGILQILSDVFGANVYCIDTTDSATKGAALRAYHGYKIGKMGQFVSFKDIVESIGGPNYTLAAKPNQKNTDIYTKLLPRRKKLEDTLPRL